MSTVDPVVIEGKVKEALAKVLDLKVEEITSEKLLVEDLNIDSFGGVELVFELEDLTGIEIKQADYMNLKTVGDVTAFICSSLNVKNATDNETKA